MRSFKVIVLLLAVGLPVSAQDTLIAPDTAAPAQAEKPRPAVTPGQVMDWIDRSSDSVAASEAGEKAQAKSCGPVRCAPKLRLDGVAQIALGFGSPDPGETEDRLLGKAARLFTMGADILARGTLRYAARTNLDMVLGAGLERSGARALIFPEGSLQNGTEVRLTEAFMDYRPYPFLGLEGGVVRVPFSRYNREYDERESPWLLRDDFHTCLIPTPWYDGGFLVKGQAAAAPFISADWQAGIISGLGDEISGGRGLEKALPSGMAFNRSNALCGNLGLKILDHAEVTLSGYTGAVDIYDRHDLDMGLLAFSLIFKHVSFDAGVMDARIDSLINSSGDTLPVAMQGSFAEIRGHYSWPRLGPLTLALRWEDLDLDKTGRAPDMIGFPSQRRAFGLGLSLSPRPGLVFKAEFRSPRNKGDLLNSGNINDDLFLLGVALGPEYLKNKAHEKP